MSGTQPNTYDGWSLSELKTECKERRYKNYLNLNKAELGIFLVNKDAEVARNKAFWKSLPTAPAGSSSRPIVVDDGSSVEEDVPIKRPRSESNATTNDHGPSTRPRTDVAPPQFRADHDRSTAAENPNQQDDDMVIDKDIEVMPHEAITGDGEDIIMDGLAATSVPQPVQGHGALSAGGEHGDGEEEDKDEQPRGPRSQKASRVCFSSDDDDEDQQLPLPPTATEKAPAAQTKPEATEDASVADPEPAADADGLSRDVLRDGGVIPLSLVDVCHLGVHIRGLFVHKFVKTRLHKTGDLITISLAPGAPKTFLEKDGDVHQLLAGISSNGSHDLVDLFRPTVRVRRNSRGTDVLSLASLVGVMALAEAFKEEMAKATSEGRNPRARWALLRGTSSIDLGSSVFELPASMKPAALHAATEAFVQLDKKDRFSDDKDHILQLLNGFSVATGAGGPPLEVFFDLPPSWVQLQTFDPIKEIKRMATTLHPTMPRYGKIRPVTGHYDYSQVVSGGQFQGSYEKQLPEVVKKKW
ncbi:uncharacterized protein EHS24_005776 [Apiotrichum porosum]|uniref:Uncharacterized protein n=1 Tax=Apiotrichum porosum TaxID=105984 RepID=A0A427XZM5_9TREE|nr:uncharacterized protein EHS24_005776 [Apiotrichum porosum]RSH84263.1 hypothetical protein EHS24_005776 [Apiotrichum porosum]